MKKVGHEKEPRDVKSSKNHKETLKKDIALFYTGLKFPGSEATHAGLSKFRSDSLIK